MGCELNDFHEAFHELKVAFMFPMPRSHRLTGFGVQNVTFHRFQEIRSRVRYWLTCEIWQ